MHGQGIFCYMNFELGVDNNALFFLKLILHAFAQFDKQFAFLLHLCVMNILSLHFYSSGLFDSYLIFITFQFFLFCRHS